MDQEEELPRTEHKLNELIKVNLNANPQYKCYIDYFEE